jgi:hypothetical protein
MHPKTPKPWFTKPEWGGGGERKGGRLPVLSPGGIFSPNGGYPLSSKLKTLFSENVFAKELFSKELCYADALLFLTRSNRVVNFVDNNLFQKAFSEIRPQTPTPTTKPRQKAHALDSKGAPCWTATER